MARKKPYTKSLLILDVALTFITGSAWLIVVLLREIWRRI